MNLRIGQGIDVHRIKTGETLWLGGILIPSEKGTVAHSDGDVLIHAVCDAMFGAVKAGDIGSNFPDTSEEYKGIDSKILLKRTYDVILERGFEIVNIDATVILQKPKLRPFITRIEHKMAEVLQINSDKISVKATTTEKLGYQGREEGITATAVVLLQQS
ncbi:MAG: 2-C-methyl-D-erythritol 2,4-cyclodiphosphate synthase [Prolixibacteraceae bacterium]|nr:2-C-methyl-D-erythritol 2,4-cyclodiphosphate synthase [Prolixibacteraceae bacterium]